MLNEAIENLRLNWLSGAYRCRLIRSQRLDVGDQREGRLPFSERRPMILKADEICLLGPTSCRATKGAPDHLAKENLGVCRPRKKHRVHTRQVDALCDHLDVDQDVELSLTECLNHCQGIPSRSIRSTTRDVLCTDPLIA